MVSIEPSTPRPRRRLLQFNLRTLLAVTVMGGAFGGLMAGRIDRARRQAAAVDMLRKSGATITYDYEWPPSQTGASAATSTGAPNGPDWARRLLGADFFDRVVSIKVVPPHNRVEKERLWETVSSLEDLEELRLIDDASPSFSQSDLDEILSQASRLPRLASITIETGGFSRRSFDGLELSDVGLNALTDLASLRELNLERVYIADSNWEKLAGIRQLRSLSLACNCVSDTSLSSVPQLQHLRHLNLAGTKVSDDGLPHLGALVALEELNLSHTRVTDAGVASLANLTNLRKLNVRSNGVTTLALQSLQHLNKLEEFPIGDPCDFGVRRAHLRHLAGWSCLKELRLGEDVTDEDLRFLSALTGLEVLWMSRAKGINGPGLTNLSQFIRLRRIYLNETNIDDAALEHVVRLPQIKVIEVRGTRVTEVATVELLTRFPNLCVTFNGDP
jgi:hypothetical protein